MSNVTKSLGISIRSFRKVAGLTQKQLADRIDISANYIAQIETSRKLPSLKLTEQIADALGVEIGELVRTDPVVSEIRALAQKADIKMIIAELQKLAFEKEPVNSPK